MCRRGVAVAPKSDFASQARVYRCGLIFHDEPPLEELLSESDSASELEEEPDATFMSSRVREALRCLLARASRIASDWCLRGVSAVSPRCLRGSSAKDHIP